MRLETIKVLQGRKWFFFSLIKLKTKKMQWRLSDTRKDAKLSTTLDFLPLTQLGSPIKYVTTVRKLSMSVSLKSQTSNVQIVFIPFKWQPVSIRMLALLTKHISSKCEHTIMCYPFPWSSLLSSRPRGFSPIFYSLWPEGSWFGYRSEKTM